MLIKEILYEDDMINGDLRLMQTLNDLVLRLYKSGITEFPLKDIAIELNKDVENIHLSSNDAEFLDNLKTNLLNNKWVDEVTNDGIIKIGDVTVGEKPNVDKDQQQDRVERLASQNLRDKSAGKDDS